FNTLLIYPNPEYQFPADITPGTPEYNDFFSSLIQSVNSFLAPYERIVNFAFLDRDFTEEQGELTRKGTFRRKVILDHFGPLIEPMYARDHLSFISGNLELKLPHWLTREWGVSRADISWNGETLAVDDRRLTIRQVSDTDLIQIGDFFYSLSTETIDLNAFFHSPRDWLGNSAWVQFIGRSLFPRIQSEAQENLILQEDRLPFCTVESLPTAQEQEHPLLYSHRLALSCFCRDHASTIQAVRSLAGDLNTSPRSGQAPLMTALLLRCRYHPRPVVRMEMIARVLPFIDGVTFLSAILDARLEASPEVATRIHEWKLTEEQFQTLLDHLAHLRREGSRETSPEHICLCLRLIGQYGRLHPSSYRWARAELVWWEMVSETEAVRTLARRQREELVTGFRSWLGLPQQLAIDPDSGEEFTWADVTLFDDQISDSSREWLLQFLQSTAGVTEAIYLFTGKILLRLEDIAPKGVWISHLGHSHGKHVYRVLIQARSGDAYNMVINHNESIPEAEFAAETGWLILLGSSHHGERLVEIFGGYWPEFGIYTEEFIPGETVLQHLEINRNKIRSGKNPDRWRMRWLHFIWNGAMAYIDFWLRTGCTYAFDRPSPANLIIPIYDYTTGTRLISISSRSRIRNPLHILVAFYRHFILETERDFPGLQRMADWEILLTAFIQKTSVKKGVEYFQDMIHNWSENPAHSEARSLGLTPDRLRRFIEDVNREGVLTKPVVFASLRYERWLQLNPHATREARASLLKELYNDYHLAALLDDYPETRIRFFLMTCFRHSHPAVKQELYALQKALRARAISLEELDIHLSRLQDLPTLSSEDSYFLSRLLFAHLGSAEQGELITWDWGAQNRLDLITAIEDEQGNVYRIRPPFLPKEIAHFHALLQEANFNPTFRQEHQFLLLFNPNRVVIGGVYWKPNGIDTAYIERVVISHHYRKQHLSTRLLEELFNRLRDKSYRYVTVGFFQAGLFYKLGFMVNKDFGGLVKPLE
ncbi:MAG: GNAT family N-acetyltransferase, partial [Candidatus Neomarinimicrobiota bacterium]